MTTHEIFSSRPGESSPETAPFIPRDAERLTEAPTSGGMGPKEPIAYQSPPEWRDTSFFMKCFMEVR